MDKLKSIEIIGSKNQTKPRPRPIVVCSEECPNIICKEGKVYCDYYNDHLNFYAQFDTTHIYYASQKCIKHQIED